MSATFAFATIVTIGQKIQRQTKEISICLINRQFSIRIPSIATILSFFWMGLGQIYNGQIGKGVAFMVSYVISWLLMFIIIGFVTTPILWIWGMVDANNSAKKINARLAAE